MRHPLSRWLESFRSSKKGLYSPISNDGSYSSTDTREYGPQLSSSRLCFQVISSRVGIAVVALLSIGLTSILVAQSGSSASVANPNKISNFLHLLVPASHGSGELCKTVFSAAVHDYPTPRLLNWNQTFDEKKLLFGGSHIAKITGSLEYLQSLGPESDNELVIIIDGYDVWFQVRPSVLIERYHAINKRAMARIRSRLGRAVDREDIRQTVIFSSQKHCWPGKDDDIQCFPLPDSELPRDIYGPLTDTLINGKEKFIKYRSRWLNSGFMMGPVADMRLALERASDIAMKNQNFGSDQAIFAEVFGRQEYQREVIRLRHLSFIHRAVAWLAGLIGWQDARQSFVLGPYGNHRSMDHYAGKPYEFSIGLDYLSELSQPVVQSPDDLAWLRYDSVAEELDKHKGLHIPPPARVTAVPEDIQRSQAPFRISNLVSLPGPQPAWDTMPLNVNLWTGVVPATIHYNWHKDRRVTHWSEIWFFPYLRQILNARVRAAREPCAVIQDPHLGATGAAAEAWWSTIDQKGGAMVMEPDVLPRFMLWEEFCGGEEIAAEVFRSDKGGWVTPVSGIDEDAATDFTDN